VSVAGPRFGAQPCAFLLVAALRFAPISRRFYCAKQPSLERLGLVGKDDALSTEDQATVAKILGRYREPMTRPDEGRT